MSAVSITTDAPHLVTANEAGRLLCMKPWPIVQLCEAGELRYTMLPHTDGGTYYAISAESVREYAQRAVS